MKLEWHDDPATFWLRVTATFVLTVLIVFVTETLNPFSVSDAVNSRAATVLQRTAAPFYTGPEGTDGQRAVTVILIDERYFRALAMDGTPGKVGWPLPVRTLTMGIIRPILEANPAALFVDITFANTPREIAPLGPVDREVSAETLGKWMRLLANRLPQPPPGQRQAVRDPIPLLLADAYQEEPGADTAPCPARYLAVEDVARRSETAPIVRSALFDLKGPDEPVPRSVEMVDSSSIDPAGYVLAPTTIGPRETCRHQSGRIASPALALYHAYGRRCDQKGTNGIACGAAKTAASGLDRDAAAGPAGTYVYAAKPSIAQGRRGEDKAASTLLNGVLAPRWGIFMSPKMARAFGERSGAKVCIKEFLRQPGSWWRTTWDVLRIYSVQILAPIEQRFGKEIIRRCAFIDTISAADLLDQRGFGASKASAFNSFLTDRVVLLGASIPQVGDRFVSPVSGDLPGVYQHAVAVENLITYRGRFNDARENLTSSPPLLLVTAMLVVLMTTLWERLKTAGCRRFGVVGELGLAPFVYFLLMLAATAIVFSGMMMNRMPPTTTVIPIIAVHVIFFSGWIDSLRLRFAAGLDWLFASSKRSDEADGDRPAVGRDRPD